MKKYSTLAAAAVGLVGLASASQAATMTLSLTYVGSTTADAGSALTQVNLSAPQFETPSWKHYFDVTATFTPDPSTTQALRFITFDVKSNNASLAATNLLIGDPTAYLGNNVQYKSGLATVSAFDGNADGGTPNDDMAIFAHTDVSKTAFIGAVGTASTKLVNDVLGNAIANDLGLVAFSFSGVPQGVDHVTITASESAGNSFSFYNANDQNSNNFTTMVGGISSGNFVIPLVPEPTSLGLLAIGGLGLLARRRRTA